MLSHDIMSVHLPFRERPLQSSERCCFGNWKGSFVLQTERAFQAKLSFPWLQHFGWISPLTPWHTSLVQTDWKLYRGFRQSVLLSCDPARLCLSLHQNSSIVALLNSDSGNTLDVPHGRSLPRMVSDYVYICERPILSTKAASTVISEIYSASPYFYFIPLIVDTTRCSKSLRCSTYTLVNWSFSTITIGQPLTVRIITYYPFGICYWFDM